VRLVALLLLLLAAGCAPQADNAILVTVDTLRADHLGAYGGPVATPALDALARESAVVARAYTPVPSTGPATVSLFSGLHPWRARPARTR
jgi:arylsulfatase A-like enzyme